MAHDGIANRNRELACFLDSPSMYTTDNFRPFGGYMLWLGLAKADYVCQGEGSRASMQNSTKDNQMFLVFLDGRVLRRTTFDHLRLYFSLSPGYRWRFYSLRAEAVCIVQANREALNGCANTAGKPESNSNL